MATVSLTKTDAWVFMAIGSGGRPAPLKAIVTSLDYLNRAMPSESEFVESVRRLGRAGLVEVSRKEFALTGSGRAALDKFEQSTGVITIMLELTDAWDGATLPEANSAFEFDFHPGEWGRAQQEYGDSMPRNVS